MDPLLATLRGIVVQASDRGLGLVAIGALAVRTYLDHPDLRLTRDLDVYVTAAAFPAVRDFFAEQGFRVYEIGPWWRGERHGESGLEIVDIAVDRIVDMTSFEAYALDPADIEMRGEGVAAPIPVPRLEDLLAMKLLAHRDKDILDAVALLRDAGDRLNRARMLEALEARDVEIPVKRGCLAVLADIRSGRLAQLWADRYGEPLDAADIGRVIATLEDLLR